MRVVPHRAEVRSRFSLLSARRTADLKFSWKWAASLLEFFECRSLESPRYEVLIISQRKAGRGDEKVPSRDLVRGSHPLARPNLPGEEWKYRDLRNCGQGCVRT